MCIMATITTVKSKILTLDAGSFQALCDAYLSKSGYPNIVALGTHAGTQKTTRGTPDTFFVLPDGKYVFVEYTTQQDRLVEKINEDIIKCLDTKNTGIDAKNISEIIYCHTSSNIAPKHDKAFRDMCEKHGIKFTIIGIDHLAEELCSKHQSLVKEHLSITIDTAQIQTEADFVEQYDANTLVAPLNTPFLFREKELEEIDAAFNNVNVVVLSGSAGTGKTRLAIQYAKSHAAKHGEVLYCIHDRALPLFDDLNMYFEQPNKYFIVVDDANQLSNLELIIGYVNKQKQGYDVKVIVTVRDYAIEKVKSGINSVARYEVIVVKPFTDKEITSLVRESLGIFNDAYLNRIVRIADGNARMAMLAGKIAIDSNRLESIDDVSQLYSEYYGHALVDAQLDSNREWLISAGIIAFLNAIHLDKIDPLLPFLDAHNLSKETFVRALYELHELEIVDIYHDKAVRFSEQCFGNFILKYVFYDKKLISLASIIEVCFIPFKSRVISSVNTLVGVFREDNLRKYVETEIKQLWEKLSREKSMDFMEYVKAFYCVNPIETLLILDKIISGTEAKIIQPQDIDTQNGKNYQSVNDDIISILGGFADTTDLDCALDLFFQYYLKRPDKYMEFYHASIVYFGIRKDSIKYDYYTTIKFIQKMIEYSSDWSNEYIVILFLDVAKSFLGLHFSPTESNQRNDGITIYNIFLEKTEGVQTYRELIWEQFVVLAENDKGLDNIRKILREYARTYQETCHQVMIDDAEYIVRLLPIIAQCRSLNECLIAQHLQRIFASIGQRYDTIEELADNDKMKLYRLLEGPGWDSGLKHEEKKQEKQRRIHEYFTYREDKIQAVKELIEVSEEANVIEGMNTHALKKSIDFALSLLDAQEYALAISWILKTQKTTFISASMATNRLLSMYPALEVYRLISQIKPEAEYDCWMYAFFSEITSTSIDIAVYNCLIQYLKSTADTHLETAFSRDVAFLEKFQHIDKDIFIKGVRLIFEKRKYSPVAAKMYLYWMFDDSFYSPEELISRFAGNFDLLTDIYVWIEPFSPISDLDGKFFFEIYKQDPKFLEKYLNAMYRRTEKHDLDDTLGKLRCLYDVENYIEALDSMVDILIHLSQYHTIDIPSILKMLIIETKGEEERSKKANEWVVHCISNKATDQITMQCLFEALTECGIDRRQKCIGIFLEHNDNFDDFRKLPLMPYFYCCSGSAVPLYSSWIKLLEGILPLLTGLRFIEHKKHVQDQIERLQQMIIDEEISNIMEG